MRRFQVTGLLAAAILISIPALRAAAADSLSGPVIGLDVGSGIPISEFQKVARVGGVVAPFVGYRLGAENIAITPMFQPQFSFFPAKDQDVTFSNADAPVVGDTRVVRRKIVKSDSQNLASITAGFRLSLYDDMREIYLGGQGGYYTDMGGPVRGAGAGFNITAGLNYRFLASTAAGVYIRRDEAYIPANLNSDDHLTFLVAGIGVTHMFAAPAPAPPPPAPVAAAPPPPAPEMPPVQKKIVLRGVNFDFDKANIRDDARPILDEAVRALGEAGEVRVAVEGHTDATGADAYNMTLSRRRAESVRAYLESHGVAGDRLTTEGFGETKPVASNETRDGRAQNRRVELRIAE